MRNVEYATPSGRIRVVPAMILHIGEKVKSNVYMSLLGFPHILKVLVQSHFCIAKRQFSLK